MELQEFKMRELTSFYRTLEMLDDEARAHGGLTVTNENVGSFLRDCNGTLANITEFLENFQPQLSTNNKAKNDLRDTVNALKSAYKEAAEFMYYDHRGVMDAKVVYNPGDDALEFDFLAIRIKPNSAKRIGHLVSTLVVSTVFAITAALIYDDQSSVGQAALIAISVILALATAIAVGYLMRHLIFSKHEMFQEALNGLQACRDMGNSLLVTPRHEFIVDESTIGNVSLSL